MLVDLVKEVPVTEESSTLNVLPDPLFHETA